MRFPLLFLIFSTVFHGPVFANEAADLIVINGNVRTMSVANPKAEAIAVSGNKIIAVGNNKRIAVFAGARTKTIDARGRLVLPGFNDAHVHFTAIGNMFSSVNLRETKTPQEMAERLAFYAKFLPKGRWILGGGWNHENWTPNQMPSKEMIDAATPDHPVFIYHADAKAALANSRALALARIDKLTKNPPDGRIDRDISSEPTGVLRGSAVELVKAVVPRSHATNWPAIAETASNYAASFGVTSVQDMHSDELTDVYRELTLRGKLKTRIYDCAPLSDWAKLAARGIKAASGDAMVRTGCLKSFYEDGDESIPQLRRDIAAADKAGFQVMIHAIGGRANDAVLDVFGGVIKENGMRDRRFRIEHAQGVRDDDVPRFVTSKIIASMQPGLFHGSASEVKTMVDGQVRVAFGSDASITDLNPLLGIFAAVNGKEGITVEQAVRAYTLGSAYAEFQENVKGTIEVGKLADFVILSEDIFAIVPGKIKDAKVLTTVVDGRVVYQANE